MANNLELSIRISAELAELRKALQTVRDEIRQFAGSATSAGQQTQKAMDGTGEKIAEEIKQGTDSGKRSLNDLENKAKTTGKNAAKGFDPFRDTVNGIKRDLLGLAAGLATLAGVKGFFGITDEAKQLEGKLRQVQKEGEDLADTQERLRDISRDTNTAFATSVDVYAKLSRSTAKLGVTQAQALTLTEQIQKLGIISQTPMESLNAAMFQFGQSLESGVFQAEDLNSVLDGAPALARAITDGLEQAGIAQGRTLKQMREQGVLTVENVLNAILSMSKRTDEEFTKLPATVQNTLTTVNDEWKKFITKLDKSTGISAAVISLLKGIRDNLDEIILAAKLVGGALLVAFAPQIVSQIAFVVTSMIRLALEAKAAAVNIGLIQKASSLLFALWAGREIGTYLRERFVEVERFGIALAGGLNEIFLKIQGFLVKTGAVLESVFTEPIETGKVMLAGYILAWADFVRSIPKYGEAMAKGMEELAARIAPAGETGKKLLKALEDIDAETKKKIAESNDSFAELFKYAGDRRKAAPGAGGDGGPIKPPPSTRKAAADSIAVAKAEAEQQLQIIEAMYSAGLIGLETYYDEKIRLTRQISDLEIAEIDRRLKAEKDADKRSELLTKRIELEKQAATEQVKIGIEKQKALNELDKKRLEQTEQLQRDLATAEGRGADARIADLQRKYEEMLKTIGDTAENRAIVDRIIDLERGKELLAELQKAMDEAIAQQKTKEQDIGQRQQAGDPTADEQLNASRATALAQLQQYKAELDALAQQGVPGAAEALKKLDAQMKETSKTVPTGLQKVGVAAAEALKGGLEDFFVSIATGSKSAGDALKDLARSFVQQMAMMAAKALAMYALLQLLNAIPGGSAIASALDIGAKVKHTGGVVGNGGTTRQVNPALFVGAPRYHSGGVAGLKPGEVPAILQTGEEVLARNDPRNVMNGGGQAQQGGSGVRILNVIDPDIVSDYMNSSSGEQTIINVLQRNAGAVKQILG
jgi:tape measure domain-containing protein